MTRQREPETFSEFKAQKLEMRRKVEYHKQQVSYHEASARACQEQLDKFEEDLEIWSRKAEQEKSLADRESIQAISHRSKVDAEELARRTNKKKAQSLYEAMIKNFK